MSCNGRIEPEKLPPTEDAARLHGFRAHYQIIKWLSLDEDNQARAIDWGWRLQDGQFVPIKSQLETAPPELCKVVRCKCSISKSNPCSSNTGSCRRMGISCVLSCGYCHGIDCCNVHVQVS